MIEKYQDSKGNIHKLTTDVEQIILEDMNSLTKALADKYKEIERLQHNQEVSTKWEIKLTQKNTKLKEENKRLKSIINEAREYVETHKVMTQGHFDGEKWIYQYFELTCDTKELLEILDKVEENTNGKD